MRNLAVSQDRIAADIAALAAITDPERPWTRRAFTPRFLEGRDWLKRRFGEAGLAVDVDVHGNLIGRRAGTRAGAGVLMLGSHSDTVPNGGRFDGIAGVIAALEVARALGERGIALRHDLEIIDCLAEEVSIFGVSCVGSRGLAGVRPAEWLERRNGEVSLADALAAVGGDPRASVTARRDIAAFLELHIEQGPVLEAGRIDIGIVSAIVGITRIEIIVQGRADHAGTTPMNARQDALVAAAELVGFIHDEALRRAGEGEAFTATVGEFAIEPNAANVVPDQARLLVDARSERPERMADFLHVLAGACRACAGRHHLAIDSRVVSDNQAIALDDGVQNVLQRGCARIGASTRSMVSGAGHDAAWMARVTRSGLIFVPCRQGRSHHPDEFATTEDIATGAAVLLESVLILDTELNATD